MIMVIPVVIHVPMPWPIRAWGAELGGYGGFTPRLNAISHAEEVPGSNPGRPTKLRLNSRNASTHYSGSNGSWPTNCGILKIRSTIGGGAPELKTPPCEQERITSGLFWV